MYTFIFLLLKVFILNLLTHHVYCARHLSGEPFPITEGYIAIILLSGKESNLTQPMAILAEQPFYRHLSSDAFTISDTLSCRLSRAGYAISPDSLFLFSSYIIPKRASNVKAIMATTKELFLLLQPSLLVRDGLL